MPETKSLYDKQNAPPGMTEVPIPLPGVPWPVLRAQLPMTEETWEALEVMLKAMKPALVKAGDAPEVDEEQGMGDE